MTQNKNTAKGLKRNRSPMAGRGQRTTEMRGKTEDGSRRGQGQRGRRGLRSHARNPERTDNRPWTGHGHHQRPSRSPNEREGSFGTPRTLIRAISTPISTETPSLPSLCSPNEREGIADPPPPANTDTYRHVPNIRWGRAEGIFFKIFSIFILIFIGKDDGETPPTTRNASTRPNDDDSSHERPNTERGPVPARLQPDVGDAQKVN